MCQWPSLLSRVATSQSTVVSMCSYLWGKLICSMAHPVRYWGNRGRAGGRLAAAAARAYSILNCRRIVVKQSFVSPANSFLLQVLKTIWYWTQTRKRFTLCFGIVNYNKDTDNFIAHTLVDISQLSCSVLLSTSSTQHWRSVDPMLKVILFITELLMHSILTLFFSAELSSPQYLRLHWCSRWLWRCHETLREHWALPGTIICASLLCRLDDSRFVDLTLANTREDGSTILRHKVPSFKLSILSIPRYKVFCSLHCKVSHQAGYLLACICSMNFWTDVPRASIFKPLQGFPQKAKTTLTGRFVCSF